MVTPAGAALRADSPARRQLIQIFLIYYGPGQFEWLKASPLWPLLKQFWFCAVLALGFNTAAYSTRLFKGPSTPSPPARWEACRAPRASRPARTPLDEGAPRRPPAGARLFQTR